MHFSEMFSIFFAALIINNIILMRFMGLCSFLGVSDKMKPSIGMSLAVAFVMIMSTAVTWPLYNYILIPFHLEFLRTISFILVIVSLVQAVEIFMKKNAPVLYGALGIYLPLITANCAILAVTFLNTDHNYDFLRSLIHTLGVAGGYSIAIILLTAIRLRLNFAPVPRLIRGYPLIFFTAALMSLAFMGFTGLFGIH
ncbi:MAG: RnfABCDGE type electron transport complex subunit A [Elusimicrobia bacterium]|nr:RnfABCDGE type electron transport complex subunit A [Candidatus Liberimonas magnetica]